MIEAIILALKILVGLYGAGLVLLQVDQELRDRHVQNRIREQRRRRR